MIGSRAAVALSLLVPLVGFPTPATAAPATAAPAACTAPTPSTSQPGYLVADPDCDLDGTPFAALPGARVHTGISAGAAYRIEVPEAWNGGLVVYAHGYRGSGTTVHVDDPALRAHYVQRGYAWAASSYATNGYDVGQGVRDSVALLDLFRQAVGRSARSVIMSGASMGGHVTAVAIEEYPRAFAGAMPYCGVLGDTALYDYFLDANVTAAALAPSPPGTRRPRCRPWPICRSCSGSTRACRAARPASLPATSPTTGTRSTAAPTRSGRRPRSGGSTVTCCGCAAPRKPTRGSPASLASTDGRRSRSSPCTTSATCSCRSRWSRSTRPGRPATVGPGCSCHGRSAVSATATSRRPS